ncbi:hypothetical protein O9992_29015 [Vibrio lentus]|nr:hypothetical protein [Vibrio lentus]
MAELINAEIDTPKSISTATAVTTRKSSHKWQATFTAAQRLTALMGF